MQRWLTRLFDLRTGEARPALQSFFILLLIIGAHTMLETARDTLFLTMWHPRVLNLVYAALAALSFGVAAASDRLTRAFGRRNALIATLGLAAFIVTFLYALTPTPRVVLVLYVAIGLIGGTLTLQFWLLGAQMFTSAQGRRLFGPIASGGVFGGMAGAGAAAFMLTRAPVTSLLLAAALAFVATALLVTTLPAPDAERGWERESTAASTATPSLAFSQQPFVWRVALLVASSTAAGLTLDYLFKSTTAHTIAKVSLGPFFARYYAVTNGLSLAVQLLLAGRLVRRLGVAGATVVMPTLLLGGGVASLLAPGALVPVMATRLGDGALRYSLNRVATELLYLPLPANVRTRAKGLIDSVLTRVVQAATAGLLFALAAASMLSPRLLSAILVAFCAVWAVTASGMRPHYLGLFRRALARGTLELDPAVAEIDVNAAEALVEAMASPDPAQVVAALDLLARRNRTKLIPALILYHDSEAVLIRALEIFGASQRTDWTLLAERLLSNPREAVRVAAVRALARHGVASALGRATDDVSSMVQAYAAFHLAALRSPGEPLTEHPLLAVILKAPGDFGDASRRGLLAAIADAPDPRAVPLVLAIVESPAFRRTEQSITLAAQAMAALKDPRFIPFCLSQLAFRVGREAVRLTLLAIGEPALVALDRAQLAQDTDRRVRLHVPASIARFGSQRAFDVLLDRMERERDGMVRYKLLRSLGRVVADNDVRVERSRVDVLTMENLVEHLRMTAYLVALGDGPDAERPAAEEVLVGLVRDKRSQSLERAFRLLKIAHNREDIHRVHIAAESLDRRARSNASEFLDSLLAGGKRRALRELFRLAAEDLEPAETVKRAAAYLGPTPGTRDEVLAALIEDHDESLATIASYCALSGGAGLRASVERARKGRPALDTGLERFLRSGPMTQAR